MEKLTLEHIAPHLPYEVKFKYDEEFVSPKFRTLEPETIEFLMNNGKPVLRPCDLTKPIQVEGKEVIPIVELASLAIPHVKWQLHKGADRVINEIGRGFCYDKPTRSFQYWEFYDWLNVPNQLALFKWLYANKFDVDGLIDAGLAIDVNTLETNPYN